MGYFAIDNRSPDLKHYGVLGMKWGVRRYETRDGKLTPLGKWRYGSFRKKGYKMPNEQADRYDDYSNNVIKSYYKKQGYRNVNAAYRDAKRKTKIKRTDWDDQNQKIADAQLKKDYFKDFGSYHEYNRDRMSSEVYRPLKRKQKKQWYMNYLGGAIGGAAKGAAEGIDLINRHGYKGDKKLYYILEEDKKTRDYKPTGKYSRDSNPYDRSISQFNKDRKEHKQKEYYNSLTKSQKLDYNYKKDHKQLSRYINRDGTDTTLGKLKYWDSYAPRGDARRQRDIERDKQRTKRRSK